MCRYFAPSTGLSTPVETWLDPAVHAPSSCGFRAGDEVRGAGLVRGPRSLPRGSSILPAGARAPPPPAPPPPPPRRDPAPAPDSLAGLRRRLPSRPLRLDPLSDALQLPPRRGGRRAASGGRRPRGSGG